MDAEWLIHRLGLGRLFWRQTHKGGRILPVTLPFYLSHCRPLVDPPMISAGEADHMKEGDIVLGLAMGGEAKAYPWWIMDNHHLANDLVDGHPVAIVLCEMCSTAVAVDPTVKGRRLIFDQRHYYNGTITMDDQQTSSVWSPYLAEAIRGRLRGTRLRQLPLSQLTWGAWTEMHPDTLVLPGYLGSRTGHGSGHSIGSPQLGPEFRSLMARWDTRLPHNTLVLGVVRADIQRAYPVDLVRKRGGVVNDDLGGLPVVVFAPSLDGSYQAFAFSRIVEGRTLTFSPTDKGPVDEETGTRWTWEGSGEDGPMAGSRLEFVPSHVSEWYVWPAHYPDIEIKQDP